MDMTSTGDLQVISKLKSYSILVRATDCALWSGSFELNDFPTLSGQAATALLLAPRKIAIQWDGFGSAVSTPNFLIAFFNKNNPGEVYWKLYRYANTSATQTGEFTLGSEFDSMKVFSTVAAGADFVLIVNITGV